MKAGLGIIRKNNFLYTEKGSFVMLEGFVIDASCELHQHHDLKPCAPQCRLCQDHCPTRALSAPFTMNPLKCVSFWNTFGKSHSRCQTGKGDSGKSKSRPALAGPGKAENGAGFRLTRSDPAAMRRPYPSR